MIKLGIYTDIQYAILGRMSPYLAMIISLLAIIGWQSSIVILVLVRANGKKKMVPLLVPKILYYSYVLILETINDKLQHIFCSQNIKFSRLDLSDYNHLPYEIDRHHQ